MVVVWSLISIYVCCDIVFKLLESNIFSFLNISSLTFICLLAFNQWNLLVSALIYISSVSPTILLFHMYNNKSYDHLNHYWSYFLSVLCFVAYLYFLVISELYWDFTDVGSSVNVLGQLTTINDHIDILWGCTEKE